MQEYYDVIKESSKEDVKADMALVLNICANNDMDSEDDAKRVYKILSNNNTIFKSGIGRLFVRDLHDRIIDYRFIERVKKENDLNNIAVVRNLIQYIDRRGDILKSYSGKDFLQQLINLEKELSIIEIINDNYDIDNTETAMNLYEVLVVDRDKPLLVTETGQDFIKKLKKKSGIAPNEKVPHIGLAIMIAILFFVAGAGLGVAAKYFHDDRESKKINDQIEQMSEGSTESFFPTIAPLEPNDSLANSVQDGNNQVEVNNSSDGTSKYAASQKASLNLSADLKVIDKYNQLYQKNIDMAGWIHLEGTDINYPVMHISNNSFYLEHDFYGNYDRNGSLFIDRYCSIFPQSENIIIYGHNVNNAPSFGQIKYYKEKQFCKYHPTIYFDTIYEEGTYDVVAAFTTSVETNGFKYYLFYGYDNEEQFNEFKDYLEKQSLYDTGVELNYGDKFITLSTCDYEVSDGRFVVVAKKKIN